MHPEAANRIRTTDGIAWVPLPTGWPPRVRGGVSARLGGASAGPLASLNLGTRTGDDPARVADNLARLSRAVNLPLIRAARAHLQHRARTLVADRPGLAGEADALVTATPGLPLAVTVADCFPLLLAAGREAVGIAHCGWRGVLAGIAQSVTRELTRVAGAPASEVRAWIGPGIGPCCFCVSAEIASRFPSGVRRANTGPQEGCHVDLAALIRRELVAAGIPAAQISSAGLCTACNPALFYSHRRDRGRTGRMLAFVGLMTGGYSIPPEPLSPGP